jgi:hypothetical protein
MESLGDGCDSFEEFGKAYARSIDFVRDAAVTCEPTMAEPTLAALRSGVLEGGATFVSENYPYLTTGALEGGIYRWKLPTVYDMAAYITSSEHSVSWDVFSAWYQGFRPGERLLQLVRPLWDSGELFLGTRLAREETSDGVAYRAGEELLSPAHSTLVARRRA